MSVLVPLGIMLGVSGDDRMGMHPLGDVDLFDIDAERLVIIGRGDPRDIAAQLAIECGHDWRRPDRLESRVKRSPVRGPAYASVC